MLRLLRPVKGFAWGVDKEGPVKGPGDAVGVSFCCRAVFAAIVEESNGGPGMSKKVVSIRKTTTINGNRIRTYICAKSESDVPTLPKNISWSRVAE